MVGDGHAMGVAAEILQHIFRAAEGRLQVHHPLFSKQCSPPSGEGLGICQQLQIGMEVELTILKSLFESVDEFSAEDFAQHFFGKEVWKNGPAPTRSHAGKLPRWSRTVRQASLPERTQATTVVFGNPLHSSQISRQSTRQASEPEPKSESAHAEAHKRNALVAERNLPRDDPRLPWPRGCQDD